MSIHHLAKKLRRSYLQVIGSAILVGVVCLSGCASTSESAGSDKKLTADVGNYPAAPQGVRHPRIGVPSFKVTTASGFGGGNGSDLNDLAADQMNTLLYKTRRFDVIERAQLQKLMDEQNMEGIVKAGELTKSGQVRGVDYLMLGRVTNLRVKRDDTRKGANLGGIGGMFSGFGFDKKDTVVTSECGVDIRIVDPATGKVVVANNSEYKRTDSAGAMGISILGGHAEGDANVSVSEDDKGKILRLALDEALRKSLPDIDEFLQNQPKSGTSALPPAPTPSTPASLGDQPANSALAAKKFCPECGKPVLSDAKFCPSCGHKMN
jgi:curli biogenesis system outer membrane secretion channel CsgG